MRWLGTPLPAFGGQRRRQRDMPEPDRWRPQVSAADWDGLDTRQVRGGGQEPRGVCLGEKRHGQERKIKAGKVGINYSSGRGAGRGETSQAGAAQPRCWGSSCGSTGCSEWLPQDGDLGLQQCHACQLALGLGTNGAQLRCGDTLGPAGAGAALGIPGSSASAGRGAGRGHRLLPGAPARRSPAPPARQHVTEHGATNWATARNRSRP